MERIVNQTHTLNTLLYASSRLFERASFYGIRSLIIIYMLGESMNLPDVKAVSIYSFFLSSLIVSKIIGAVIGDFLLNNRNAMILGGIIQTVGCFCLCITSIEGLYIGIGFIVIGGGLYEPNMFSSFGKTYLNKTKLLDAGFTVMYLAVNIGAFFGVLFIAYFGEKHGWNTGFGIGGFFMLVSVFFLFFSKTDNPIISNEKKIAISKRVLKIIIAFLLIGLFWASCELYHISSFDIQMILSENSSLNIPKSLWTSLSSFFIIPVSIIAAITWSFFYSSKFTKLTIGFILFAISIGVLFLIPQTPTNQHGIIYLISLAFLSFSEVHVAPVIYSILTKYSNPKYLAIIISVAFIPTKLFSSLINFFSEDLYKNQSFTLNLTLTLIVIISLGMLIYFLLSNKNTAK